MTTSQANPPAATAASSLEPVGPLSSAEVAALSGPTELMAVASEAFRVRCSQTRCWPSSVPSWTVVKIGGPGGATSLGSWLVQHLGVSDATARTYSPVAERQSTCLIWPLGSPRAVSLGQGASLCGCGHAQTEARWAEAAGELSFRDLGELVRSKKLPSRASDQAEQESARCASTIRCAPSWPSCPRWPMPSAFCAREAGQEDLLGRFDPLGPALGRRLGLVDPRVTLGPQALPWWWPMCPSRSGDPESQLVGELERGGLDQRRRGAKVGL